MRRLWSHELQRELVVVQLGVHPDTLEAFIEVHGVNEDHGLLWNKDGLLCHGNLLDREVHKWAGGWPKPTPGRNQPGVVINTGGECHLAEKL